MENKKLTSASGAPVADNHNVATAGRRGPMLLQNVWFLEKLAHFDREVIPERRMHAKGSGAFGKFTVTHDITAYTKAAIFSQIGKETELFVRFSTVAGERGAADAERDIRGFAIKFYTALNPQLHSRSATYIKRNGLLIRKITIKSSRPFQCAYHPLTP